MLQSICIIFLSHLYHRVDLICICIIMLSHLYHRVGLISICVDVEIDSKQMLDSIQYSSKIQEPFGTKAGSTSPRMFTLRASLHLGEGEFYQRVFTLKGRTRANFAS
jgi:hypothetical protein